MKNAYFNVFYFPFEFGTTKRWTIHVTISLHYNLHFNLWPFEIRSDQRCACNDDTFCQFLAFQVLSFSSWGRRGKERQTDRQTWYNPSVTEHTQRRTWHADNGQRTWHWFILKSPWPWNTVMLSTSDASFGILKHECSSIHWPVWSVWLTQSIQWP